MANRTYKKKHRRPKGYRSPLELVAQTLLPKNAKFEPEKLKYFIEHEYTPDFVITTPSGKKIYIEVKGYLRYEDQRKMKAVKQSNPDLDIRFFFAEDRRVHTLKALNSEWCAKHGFPCAIGKFPRGWFK